MQPEQRLEERHRHPLRAQAECVRRVPDVEVGPAENAHSLELVNDEGLVLHVDHQNVGGERAA